MVHGSLTSLVTGLLLVGLSYPLFDGENIDNAKITVKLVVALVIAVLVWVNRRKDAVPKGLLHGIGALALLNVTVAVLWSDRFLGCAEPARSSVTRYISARWPSGRPAIPALRTSQSRTMGSRSSAMCAVWVRCSRSAAILRSKVRVTSTGGRPPGWAEMKTSLTIHGSRPSSLTSSGQA